MDGLYQQLAAAYARGMLPDAGTAAGVRRRTGPPQSPPPERRARQGDCPDARPVGAAHRMPRAGYEVARALARRRIGEAAEACGRLGVASRQAA